MSPVRNPITLEEYLWLPNLKTEVLKDKVLKIRIYIHIAF